MDDQTSALVAMICNTESAAEAVSMFATWRDLLGDYKFALAAKRGPRLGFAASRSFHSGAAIRSIFASDNVLLLDAETITEMAEGKAHFLVDQSVSLDTQALSYLRPYFENSHAPRLPADFSDVFEFIARPEVCVDPIPYVTENLRNLGDAKNEAAILANLRAYEVFRTVDVEALRATGRARSTRSEAELDSRSSKLLVGMRKNRADTKFYSEVCFRYNFLYAQLLKMVEIQFRSSGSGVDAKMEEFLEFLHGALSCMSAREIALARAYFERGQTLLFFGKVQRLRPKLFRHLSSMTWDLYHVRQLELALTLQVLPGARYFFPALLTFDKKFIEIIDLYPLKAVAFSESSRQIFPFYDGSWQDLLASTESNVRIFSEKYYSESARRARADRIDHARSTMEVTVRELELKLAKLASVEAPVKET